MGGLWGGIAAGVAVATLGLGALSLAGSQPAGGRPPEAPRVAAPAPDRASVAGRAGEAGEGTASRARPEPRPGATPAGSPARVNVTAAIDTAPAARPEAPASAPVLIAPDAGPRPEGPTAESPVLASQLGAAPGSPARGDEEARLDAAPAARPEAALAGALGSVGAGAPLGPLPTPSVEAPVPSGPAALPLREPRPEADLLVEAPLEPMRVLQALAVPEAATSEAPWAGGAPASARVPRATPASPGRAAAPQVGDAGPASDLTRSAPTPDLVDALPAAGPSGAGGDLADEPSPAVAARAGVERAPGAVGPDPLGSPARDALAARPEAPPAPGASPSEVVTGPVLPPSLDDARPSRASPVEPERIVLQGGGLPGAGARAVRVNRPGASPTAAPPPPGAPEDAPALLRFAASFEVPEDGRPLLAVVLLDQGTWPGAEAALATLPVPVSVALDPAAPDAAERMAAYRARGIEVLALAELPRGARPVDAAVQAEATLAVLPEAVAVLDLGAGGLEAGGATTRPTLRRLAEGGLGAVLPAGGLGSSLREAEDAGVPAAAILRDLDGAGQDERAILRALDDAARRAGQGRGVAVLARVRPETLAALDAWAGGRRAAEVALAPVSALLRGAGAGPG